MKAAWVALGGVLSSTAALAADGIAVTRGSDSTVYGNCVPSLVVENSSGETIDYLQVDLVLALRDGRQRVVELKSAYREGVPAPIAPGATATLRQHLDTSRALGVPCGEISERRVSGTVCETEHGTLCASSVLVQP
ncbi:hypothetical protein [Reyranella sp.]|uniref:hypothetical protein n=1 Tax=Reyranella sp. TaxID=1929291 RepID=UPI0040363C2A